MIQQVTYRAFSMVEILIALVLLAVGLLGLAGMTQIVMKGNSNANHLGNATDICQLRIEELKDVSFESLGIASDPASVDGLDFGAELGKIVQEIGLNTQGLTHCQYFDQESVVAGSPCFNVTTSGCSASEVLTSADFSTGDQACWTHINDAGPYIYARSFVVCDGKDHTGAGGTHGSAGTSTTFTTGTYSGEINCQAEDGVVRPETLTCVPDDILTPGAASNEKMIKILCTWRKRDGRCGFVNFGALRVDL